jgi:hypothetical protein
MEEFGVLSKDSHMFAMEFPMMLDHMLVRATELKSLPSRRRLHKAQQGPEHSED